MITAKEKHISIQTHRDLRMSISLLIVPYKKNLLLEFRLSHIKEQYRKEDEKRNERNDIDASEFPA